MSAAKTKPAGAFASALLNPFVVMSLVFLMYVAKAAVKIAIGSSINSPMIAGDGFHNIADLFEALVVIVVIFVARLPRSREYPYGRQNIEFFSSLAIGGALGFLGFKFAAQSLVGLLSLFPEADLAVRALVSLPVHEPLKMDAATFPWVVAVTAGSVILSVVVSRYQIAVGKRSGHASLVADGEETASDGRIELVTLAGVLGEYFFHAPWLEYPLGLLVAYLICRTGFQLLGSAWRVLLQHSIGVAQEAGIREICGKTAGVIEVARLKTFQVGHTAVVMVTLTSLRRSPARAHIRYAIEEALRGYLLGEEFKELDLHLKIEAPEPERHRQAFALCRLGGATVVARRLADVTHLAVCDLEHGVIVRAVEEPSPADVLTFLSTKRVEVLHLFQPTPEDERLLAEVGVAVSRANTFVPSALGLTTE